MRCLRFGLQTEVIELDGVSSGFRRHGVTEEHHWSLEGLLSLGFEINELHQLAIAQVARIVVEQQQQPRPA